MKLKTAALITMIAMAIIVVFRVIDLIDSFSYIWEYRVFSAQFKFSVASSRGANQRWCIHDTGRTGCPQCHAAVL